MSTSSPLTVDAISGLRCMRRGRRCLAWGLILMALVTMVTITGCTTPFDVSALKADSALDKHESIDGIMGPTERNLKQIAWERQKQELTAGRSPEDREALARYEAAEKLFDNEEYGKAEREFKSIARDRRRRGLNWSERIADTMLSRSSSSFDQMIEQFGDPLEEDALFMVAEAQFAQRKYSWAQDSYNLLLEKYPSSRHLNTVTRRLFKIAHTWLGFPDADENGDVKLASGELMNTNPRIGKKDFQKPAFLNVTNRSRPVFDTAGRGLQALQSIWMNDANGPLADDALMLTANYHLQTGDFVEAARVYQLVREQYPDSPHFKDAHVLESHVRLAAYEGPAYDSKGLRASKELKESARELFPDLSEQQRAMLDKELANIARAEEHREWHNVKFYKSKGDDTAVALYCNRILNRHPDSPYADDARRELEEIADRRRNQGRGFNLFGNSMDKQPNSPVLAGIGSAPASPTAPSDRGRARVSTAPPSQTQHPPEDPGFFRRFLRRTETDPQLKPVK